MKRKDVGIRIKVELSNGYMRAEPGSRPNASID